MFDDPNVVLHCEKIDKIYPGTAMTFSKILNMFYMNRTWPKIIGKIYIKAGKKP